MLNADAHKKVSRTLSEFEVGHESEVIAVLVFVVAAVEDDLGIDGIEHVTVIGPDIIDFFLDQFFAQCFFTDVSEAAF